MRLLIGIMLLLLIFGLAESVQVGGTAGRTIALGSLSQEAPMQTDALNQTNITDQINVTDLANITDQVNATEQPINAGSGRSAVAIKNPMSTIPVSNTRKSAFSPDSAQANSIAYQFTT